MKPLCRHSIGMRNLIEEEMAGQTGEKRREKVNVNELVMLCRPEVHEFPL
jgi:hypothetical protein